MSCALRVTRALLTLAIVGVYVLAYPLDAAIVAVLALLLILVGGAGLVVGFLAACHYDMPKAADSAVETAPPVRVHLSASTERFTAVVRSAIDRAVAARNN